MKSRFTFTLVAIGALMLCGCNADANPMTWISLDFPHGALRLLVQRGGDTRLFYGARPTSRVVKNGTFDIDELFQQLRTRLHDVVPAEGRPFGQPYGMVTLEFSESSKRDYLIYDQAFAGELLKTACANSLDDEESAQEIFTAECAKLGRTIPED